DGRGDREGAGRADEGIPRPRRVRAAGDLPAGELIGVIDRSVRSAIVCTVPGSYRGEPRDRFAAPRAGQRAADESMSSRFTSPNSGRSPVTRLLAISNRMTGPGFSRFM